MPGKRCRGQWWHEEFKGRGFRITAAREAILEVLSRAGEHLSAEDVYLGVHADHPQIGLTTVYRTLELLVQVGLVYKLDFGDKRARYELAQGPGHIGHHHHLVCTGCGLVVDYTDFIDREIELLTLTEKGLSEKFGFTITNHLIQFYGLCPKCRQVG